MLEETYFCLGTLVFEGDPRVITEVSQNHVEGRNDSHVTSVMINNQFVAQLPRNFGEFFPNLEGLAVIYSYLEEISREDLVNLPRLRQLDLFANNVRSLDSDLLRGNPFLEAFSVYYNPVRRVGLTTFDNLPHLTSLHFSETGCINERADENRLDVENLIFHLAVNCPPTFQMIEKDFLAGAKFQRTIDLQIADRINPLAYQVYLMDKILHEHEERIVELEREVQELSQATESTLIRKLIHKISKVSD